MTAYWFYMTCLAELVCNIIIPLFHKFHKILRGAVQPQSLPAKLVFEIRRLFTIFGLAYIKEVFRA